MTVQDEPTRGRAVVANFAPSLDGSVAWAGAASRCPGLRS